MKRIEFVEGQEGPEAHIMYRQICLWSFFTWLYCPDRFVVLRNSFSHWCIAFLTAQKVYITCINSDSLDFCTRWKMWITLNYWLLVYLLFKHSLQDSEHNIGTYTCVYKLNALPLKDHNIISLTIWPRCIPAKPPPRHALL